MKLIIGLGNPGVKYIHNRHNAGYMFVDFIKDSGLGQNDVLKTNTFMNDSGVFVKKITRTKNLEPSNLYIVHDDLDIPLGQFKIQMGVGPKVHNGINSIESALGGKDFWRIRIGIDNRPHFAKASRGKGEDYVLQDFTKEELEILKQVQDDIYAELKKRFSQG